jgi:hypothetical protein
MNEIVKQDDDAREIGDLYRRARGCAVKGVRYAIQAGSRLTDKKKSLAHGQWLPWLEANADVLGFDTPRTAQRLITAASKYDVDVAFDEAPLISREIWGNTQRKLPKPQRDDDLEEPEDNEADSYQLEYKSPWDAHGQPRPDDDGMPTAEEAEESHQQTLYEQARLLWESMTGETRQRFLAHIGGNQSAPTPAPKKRGRPKGSKNKPKDVMPEPTPETANMPAADGNDPGPIPEFLRRDAA